MRALRFAGAAGLGSALLVLSSFGGCGGNAFQTGGGGNDASTGDGPQNESGSSSGGGDDGAPGDDGSMVAGEWVYVAAGSSAKDSNSGLDPQHPVRTIKRGLDIAQGLADAGVKVPTVAVCSGSYPEDSLHVGFDVYLYGSYDCTTDPSMWKRAPGYGAPTFDAKVLSVISWANTTSQQATLSIVGAVTSSTKVDGFSIVGATSVASGIPQSVGLEVAAGATPVLSNLVIDGGSGSAGTADAGSIGVRFNKSNAELKDSAIVGGAGKGPNGSGYGSIGIRVESGSPNIHDDVVTGGTGTGGSYSSVGIDVQSSLTTAGGNPLTNVYVVGTDANASPTASIAGVLVQSGSGANLDLVDSVVAGTGTTSGTTQAAAVDVESGGAVTLLRDRIAGGIQMQGDVFGVFAMNTTSLTIVNSEIHAGDVANPSGSTHGVYLGSSASKAAIVFDTIYTGAQGGQHGGVAIGLGAGATNVSIEDDLLLGSDSGGGATGAAGAAVTAATCTGSGKQIRSLDHTGFANFTELLYCSDSGQGDTLPAGITVTLDAGGTCMTTCGNVLVAATCIAGKSDCVTDQSCPTQPPDACMQSILGMSWPSANDGLGSAAADAGASGLTWQIEQPGNFCKLTQGGVPNPAATDDLLKVKRSTTKPTMGAVEYSGAACLP